MTKFRSFSSALAAGVVGSLLWMGSASAQLITVQVQEDAGPIQIFTNGGAGPSYLIQPPRVLRWVQPPSGAPLVLMPGR